MLDTPDRCNSAENGGRGKRWRKNKSQRREKNRMRNRVWQVKGKKAKKKGKRVEKDAE